MFAEQRLIFESPNGSPTLGNSAENQPDQPKKAQRTTEDFARTREHISAEPSAAEQADRAQENPEAVFDESNSEQQLLTEKMRNMIKENLDRIDFMQPITLEIESQFADPKFLEELNNSNRLTVEQKKMLPSLMQFTINSINQVKPLLEKQQQLLLLTSPTDPKVQTLNNEVQQQSAILEKQFTELTSILQINTTPQAKQPETALAKARTMPEYSQAVLQLRTVMQNGADTTYEAEAQKLLAPILVKNPDLFDHNEVLETNLIADAQNETFNYSPEETSQTKVSKALSKLKGDGKEIMEHVRNKDWGKVFEKGLEMFLEIMEMLGEFMNTVGDKMAKSLKDTDLTLINKFAPSLATMAGADRIAFYQTVGRLNEHDIAIVEDETIEGTAVAMENPPSSLLLNTYNSKYRAKNVSVNKYLETVEQKIIASGDKRITPKELTKIAMNLGEIEPGITPEKSTPPPESAGESASSEGESDDAAKTDKPKSNKGTKDDSNDASSKK